MHAGRIIADSDEDDDLSPVPSPARPTPADRRLSVKSPEKITQETASTDPEFFRSVYLAEQQAAAYVALRAAVAGFDGLREPDSGRTEEVGGMESEPLVGTLRVTQNGSSNGWNEESGEKSTGAEYDPWAMPSSPERPPLSTKRKVKTKALKSKGRATRLEVDSSLEVIDLVSPARQSSTERCEGGVEGEYENTSPLPARKRRRISDLRMRTQTCEEGFFKPENLVLDSSLDASDGKATGYVGGSTSLYIEPSTMTESQKQQYVNISQDFPSTLDEPSNLNEHTHLARSSGSATVAYPTPTQYRNRNPSSMLPPLAESPLNEPAKKITRRRQSSLPSTAPGHPNSSPDLISAAPVEGRAELDAESEVLAPLVEQDDSYDEDWNEKDFGIPRQSEPRRTLPKRSERGIKRKTRQAALADAAAVQTEDLDNVDAEVLPEERTEPKKRGRKKKVASPEPEMDGDELAQSDAPAPKRKRGRPRKQEKIIAASEDEDDNDPQPEAQPADAVEAGSHAGGVDGTGAEWCDDDDASKRTGEQGPGSRVASPGCSATEEAIQDAAAGMVPEFHGNHPAVHHTGPAPEKSPVKPAQDGTSAKEGTKGTKGAGPQGQSGKGVYRVGLSRRSRIAPLLKCIRK